jgi:AraC-like DNA-binding protein
MNQFVLQYGKSTELLLFPHILEVGLKKNASISFNTFLTSATEGLRIYYFMEGRFEWRINNQLIIFYPGDVAVVMPGVPFGSDKGNLEIGAFTWIHLGIQKLENGQIALGKWSGLSDSEGAAIGKILLLNPSPVLSRFSEAGKILKCIHGELFGNEVAYQARINHQLDELLIQVTRQNLAHQWTVEEMSALVGMGTTLFTERVKTYSGFSPINYLINIRISEAIRLLKRPGITVTDIALDTGFYSSQHFSTTFKKLTGYRPSEFRNNHLRNK